jgi:Tol biopolymer transport system component
MKTRFFTSLFLLVVLILQASTARVSSVDGKAVIENPKQAVRSDLSPPANENQTSGVLLAGTTTRVSIASDGSQGNNLSEEATISADGRFIAFTSFASNLVPDDTNGVYDIFVHDRQTDQTNRVSVASDGTQGNSHSSEPVISADGRYVAFASYASNLVAGDTNSVRDIFVHDRQTGQTSRVSVASDGTQGNSNSFSPSISADGDIVAFHSYASNLVPGDTNNERDVFVHDQQTGQTNRVSISSSGIQADNWSESPAISADGRYVAFESEASNLVIGDTNGVRDIFLHDRQTGQTNRVSVASDGTQGNGLSFYASISANGRYIAFSSNANNLVSNDTNGAHDVFVHDQQTGQTSRVSVASDGTQGIGYSGMPSISANGRYVAFGSAAGNLVPGDTNGSYDIFIHDRSVGQTSRVSVASDGTQGNNMSVYPSVSASGRYVAFTSFANNLVPGDTNNHQDVFVHERSVTIPSLSSNYHDGQPGSFFTITGSGFPPSSLAAVVVNGTVLTATLPVDSDGELLFLLDTGQADAGHYFVTVTANPSATADFTLDPAAPLRPQEESGPVFNVPSGIAIMEELVYLPLILSWATQVAVE